jgi:hypothetical protein
MTSSRSHYAIYNSEPEYDLDLSGLTPALARAVRERWRMAPVAAHSRHASLKSSCLANPTNDPEEIIRWATIPNLNWCVETGRRSGLLVLEVNHGTGQDLLSELCEDSWDGWLETLKFQDHLSTHFFFRYAGQRVRFLRSQFEGLKIHAGTLLFLPPCWFVSAPPLVYSDLNASLLDCPAWLLDFRGLDRDGRKVIPFPARS